MNFKTIGGESRCEELVAKEKVGNVLLDAFVNKAVSGKCFDLFKNGEHDERLFSALVDFRDCHGIIKNCISCEEKMKTKKYPSLPDLTLFEAKNFFNSAAYENSIKEKHEVDVAHYIKEIFTRNNPSIVGIKRHTHVRQYIFEKFATNTIIRPVHKIENLENVRKVINASKKIVVIGGSQMCFSNVVKNRFQKELMKCIRVNYPDCNLYKDLFDINYYQKNFKPMMFYLEYIMNTTKQANISHNFINDLQKKGNLLRMYTENFDEIEAIAGIKNLVYANGTFRKWQCMKCKFSRILSKTDYEFIAKKAPLKCKRRCRGVLRPCINFTKEKPTDEMIVGLDDDINKADLVLVVGSDMTAPHICVLPYLFKNVPKIYIGEEMPTSFVPTYSILGNCNVICNILQSNDEITPEIEFSYLTERESDLGEHVPVTKKIKDMFNCGLFTSIFQYIMLRKAVSTKALMATNAVSALSQDTYIKSKYIYINKRICLFEHGKAFYIPNMDEKYGFFYCREQLQQLKIIKKVKKNIRYLDTKRKKVNSDKSINEVEEFGEEFAKKMWKILKLDPVDLKENGNVNVPNISPNTTETQSKHLIRNNFKKGKRLLSQVLKSNCHVPSKKICSE